MTPGGILVMPPTFVYFLFLCIHFLPSLHSSIGGNWAHKVPDPFPPTKSINVDLNGDVAIFGVWFYLMRFSNGSGRDLGI